MTWEEVNRVFEETYQEILPADDSSIAVRVSSVSVEQEDHIVKTVNEIAEEVYELVNDQEEYDAFITEFYKGMSYALQENGIGTDQAIVDHRVFNENPEDIGAHGYVNILLNSGDKTWELKLGDSPNRTPDDKYRTAWNIEAPDQFAPDIKKSSWTDQIGNLFPLNFSKRKKVKESALWDDEAHKLGWIYNKSFLDDDIIVGKNDERPDGFNPEYGKPYDDVHFTEEAKEYVEGVMDQESINSSPERIGDQAWNLTITSSQFFHNHIAETDYDMEIHFIQNEKEAKNLIENHRENGKHFLTYEAEEGYVMHRQVEDKGPVQNPPSQCEIFDELDCS